MSWILKHLQHLLGYPAVACAARWIGQYEITRLKKRRETMNMHLLSELVDFIEGLFKHTAPVVVSAAEGAAIETAEQDPKVQAVTVASVALLNAAKDLKTAINAQPAAAPAEEPAKPAEPAA